MADQGGGGLGTTEIDWLIDKGTKAYDWSQKELAPRVFGDKDLDGTRSEPVNGHGEAPPDGQYGGFKPSTGNKTIDGVIDWFR
jgi:hypothetical protein